MPVSQPSAETEGKGGRAALHTHRVVLNLHVLFFVTCVIGGKVNRNLLKCPEAAVVLYKPLSMSKNLHKEL